MRPIYRVLFHLLFLQCTTIRPKIRVFIDIYLSFDKNICLLSFILSLYTTIRPKTSVVIDLFFYLYMTIRPKLGVTLKFIIFLIVPIFCLQYCLYISSATIIPLYLVYYIHRSAALIFLTLYPWLQSATIIPLYFVHYIHRSAALIFRALYPWLYEARQCASRCTAIHLGFNLTTNSTHSSSKLTVDNS